LTTFCDSSALVKRYADEPGAKLVRSLGAVVVSALARVEVPAALWRKHRVGELDASDTATLVAQFEYEWFDAGAFAVVQPAPQILNLAARLVARQSLRAYDGVQLATAVVARAADPEITKFACFDETLAIAASAEGFRVVR
jgi:predicted nucleic acid-binding protein